MLGRPFSHEGSTAIRQHLKATAVAALCLALSAGVAEAASRKKAPKADEIPPRQQVGQTVVDLAAWVVATADNRGLPFAIIDKSSAQLLVFGEDGKIKGMAPVLIGSAVGDFSAPGVGDRELSDIPMADRTTPAGRYLAAYGPAPGRKRVLWIDYASAVSIHPLIDTVRAEQRPERLASETPDDNRVTHGCVNVSAEFYEKIVQPTFHRAGIFYVLPDSTPLSEALPGFDPPAREPPPRRKRWWQRAIERAPQPEVAKQVQSAPKAAADKPVS